MLQEKGLGDRGRQGRGIRSRSLALRRLTGLAGSLGSSGRWAPNRGYPCGVAVRLKMDGVAP